MQLALIEQISQGWRPVTPLSRGGQVPLSEPIFKLEKFKKDVDSMEWRFFNFSAASSLQVLADSSDVPADDVATVSDSSDESSSSSSSSSSEETELLPQSKKSKVATVDPLGPAEEALIGLHRRTWHIMVPSPIEIIFTNLAKSGVEDGMWPLSFTGYGASRFGAPNRCKSSVVQSRRLPQRVPQHWIAQLNSRSVVQQKRIGAIVETPQKKSIITIRGAPLVYVYIFLYTYS